MIEPDRPIGIEGSIVRGWNGGHTCTDVSECIASAQATGKKFAAPLGGEIQCASSGNSLCICGSNSSEGSVVHIQRQ